MPGLAKHPPKAPPPPQKSPPDMSPWQVLYLDAFVDDIQQGVSREGRLLLPRPWRPLLAEL